MKHSIAKLAILALASLGTVVSAQTASDNTQPVPPAEHGHRAVSPDQQVKNWTKKLALSADQQNQALTILTDRQQQVAAIQNDASLDAKQRHAKLKDIRNDADAKFRSMLNDAQRSTYDEARQQARERAKARRQTTVS